jgi:hypothetical protein
MYDNKWSWLKLWINLRIKEYQDKIILNLVDETEKRMYEKIIHQMENIEIMDKF